MRSHWCDVSSYTRAVLYNLCVCVSTDLLVLYYKVKLSACSIYYIFSSNNNYYFKNIWVNWFDNSTSEAIGDLNNVWRPIILPWEAGIIYSIIIFARLYIGDHTHVPNFFMPVLCKKILWFLLIYKVIFNRWIKKNKCISCDVIPRLEKAYFCEYIYSSIREIYAERLLLQAFCCCCCVNCVAMLI